ncbi:MULTISPECIES: peptide chain release factor N(5)-glutamine methyltransferase [unclassified Saccharicrinis]|uniref:peptide chain release factor N(5)-glutamine methyltransferase n=1 Tax=unclassified Saccharicrinis TaxID=2646859 RepID=UPI003D34E350
MEFTNIKQVSAHFKNSLEGIYPQEEIRNFIWIIFEHLLGFSKVDIMMKEEHVLDANQQQFCKNVLDKLQQHVPIQHLIGATEFYGLPFHVNKHVLIPRPETEELVKWILDDNHLSMPKILDIGTGTGCIPISLKKNLPNAEVDAWDISPEALMVAQGNANLNQVEISFQLIDALNPTIDKKHHYDIIVSNPPYIRALEKELMQDNVLKHEPHLALFVEDKDPLLFYRSIGKLAKNMLKSNGLLYFEINEALGKETCALLQQLGFKWVELRKDLFGKDRMIKAGI